MYTTIISVSVTVLAKVHLCITYINLKSLSTEERSRTQHPYITLVPEVSHVSLVSLGLIP